MGEGEGAIPMRISKFLYPPSIARCQHVKVNGVQCGSPSLKNRKLCHFHQRWQQGRIQLNANQARRSRYSLDLPILEDANSIQVALMQGMRLLLTNQVDHRTAALLFYALQTASSSLSRTTFEPRPQQVVIDPSSISDTSLGDDAWYKEEFTEDEQEAAETNDQPAAHSRATVDIQAMACPLDACLLPGVASPANPASVLAPLKEVAHGSSRFSLAADSAIGGHRLCCQLHLAHAPEVPSKRLPPASRRGQDPRRAAPRGSEKRSLYFSFLHAQGYEVARLDREVQAGAGRFPEHPSQWAACPAEVPDPVVRILSGHRRVRRLYRGIHSSGRCALSDRVSYHRYCGVPGIRFGKPEQWHLEGSD